MTTAAPEQRLADVILDPVKFARGILGHDVWPVPAAILRSVANNSLTAVKACHASSKTFTAAEAVLWWITRYSDGKVVTTAPTWNQVEKLLWREIRIAAKDSQIAYPPINLTELKLSDERFAVGLSTDDDTKFQGWHGEHVLIVLDEAPGVRAQIYEAIEGIRAGGDVHVLAIGNPTIVGGPFYEAFKSPAWAKFTISAFDTPNLAGLTLKDLLALPPHELDHNPRSYLVSRRWVREKYEQWGERHPLWQSRVLGEFPSEQENSVIPLSWVEAAQARWKAKPPASGPVDAIGVDVGGGGEGSDMTVFALKRGMVITELRRDQRGDTMVTTGRVKAMLDARGGTAVVDVIGIGAGVVSRLRELRAKVEPFNAAERTDIRDRSNEMGFTTARSAAWWNMRELLDPTGGHDVALPPDDRLLGDLTAPTWRIQSGGRIQVEPKDEIKKRLGRSTDDGDAVVMAFWPDRAGPSQGVW